MYRLQTVIFQPSDSEVQSHSDCEPLLLAFLLICNFRTKYSKLNKSYILSLCLTKSSTAAVTGVSGDQLWAWYIACTCKFCPLFDWIVVRCAQRITPLWHDRLASTHHVSFKALVWAPRIWKICRQHLGFICGRLFFSKPITVQHCQHQNCIKRSRTRCMLSWRSKMCTEWSATGTVRTEWNDTGKPLLQTSGKTCNCKYQHQGCKLGVTVLYTDITHTTAYHPASYTSLWHIRFCSFRGLNSWFGGSRATSSPKHIQC